MSVLPRSGTRDFFGEEKQRMDFIRETLVREFEFHGYSLIQPPILEDPQVFVERSGEEIRQRMYAFNDPSARPQCLRPEMTIPACRLYLNQLAKSTDINRICYDGLVHRYDPVSFGRLREFRQIGVEYFGDGDTLAIDAEIVALAYRCVSNFSIDDNFIEMNDLSIIETLLKEIGIEPSFAKRVREKLGSDDGIESLVSEAESEEERDTSDEPSDRLAKLLRDEGADALQEFVVALLSLSKSDVPPGRSIEDIASRLVTKIERRSVPRISHETADLIKSLTGVRGPAKQSLSAVAGLIKQHSLPKTKQLIDDLSRRVSLSIAAGVPEDRLRVNMSQSRSLAYYTGFIFEVHSPGLRGASELGSGGRYDNLLSQMGASENTPAVGFALGGERMELALRDRPDAFPSANPTMDAMVVKAGNVEAKHCFEIATKLRNAGWLTKIEMSNRRPRSAIALANRLQIPYVVFVGEDELANGQVNVKHLASESETAINIDELEAFVKRTTERSE